MTKRSKVLEDVLRGTSDANISFADICHLLERLGFDRRVRGSHNIFTCDGVEEIINLQAKNAKTKPYQVRQVRDLILKYKMGDKDV